MFKVVSTLTNTKPPKSTIPELETAPTKGQFRLNPAGARAMGVAVGDYVAILTAEEEVDGEAVVNTFLTQGHASNEETGAETYGSKLGASNERGTGSLTLSAQNAWNQMEGSDATRRVYVIDEVPVVVEGTSYYRVSFDREEAKQERKSSN